MLTTAAFERGMASQPGRIPPAPIMEGQGPETRKPATDGRASCPAEPGWISFRTLILPEMPL
jgi:hypothetical protein